jgi:hypothetical protein
MELLRYTGKTLLSEVGIKSKNPFDTQHTHNLETDTIDKAELPP